MKFLILALTLTLSFSAAHAESNNCEKSAWTSALLQTGQIENPWCQTTSKATGILIKLLGAIKNEKAKFYSGVQDLNTLEGFNGIALGGYQLDSAITFTKNDGTSYIGAHFTGTDKTNDQVKYYYAIYKVEADVID